MNSAPARCPRRAANAVGPLARKAGEAGKAGRDALLALPAQPALLTYFVAGATWVVTGCPFGLMNVAIAFAGTFSLLMPSCTAFASTKNESPALYLTVGLPS